MIFMVFSLDWREPRRGKNPPRRQIVMKTDWFPEAILAAALTLALLIKAIPAIY